MSAWRADLVAAGRAPTLWQALVGWIANPGFALACHHRAAHWAVGQGRLGRAVALVLERRMIATFGCHLSAQAHIGPGVRFPHPVGIVVGEGVVIGAGATLYQQVTLGRRTRDAADYPCLGDCVVVYCGATLLGRVAIADGGVVGAQRLVIAREP